MHYVDRMCAHSEESRSLVVSSTLGGDSYKCRRGDVLTADIIVGNYPVLRCQLRSGEIWES